MPCNCSCNTCISVNATAAAATGTGHGPVKPKSAVRVSANPAAPPNFGVGGGMAKHVFSGSPDLANPNDRSTTFIPVIRPQPQFNEQLVGGFRGGGGGGGGPGKGDLYCFFPTPGGSSRGGSGPSTSMCSPKTVIKFPCHSDKGGTTPGAGGGTTPGGKGRTTPGRYGGHTTSDPSRPAPTSVQPVGPNVSGTAGTAEGPSSTGGEPGGGRPTSTELSKIAAIIGITTASVTGATSPTGQGIAVGTSGVQTSAQLTNVQGVSGETRSYGVARPKVEPLCRGEYGKRRPNPCGLLFCNLRVFPEFVHTRRHPNSSIDPSLTGAGWDDLIQGAIRQRASAGQVTLGGVASPVHAPTYVSGTASGHTGAPISGGDLHPRIGSLTSDPNDGPTGSRFTDVYGMRNHGVNTQFENFTFVAVLGYSCQCKPSAKLVWFRAGKAASSDRPFRLDPSIEGIVGNNRWMSAITFRNEIAGQPIPMTPDRYGALRPSATGKGICFISASDNPTDEGDFLIVGVVKWEDGTRRICIRRITIVGGGGRHRTRLTMTRNAPLTPNEAAGLIAEGQFDAAISS